MARCLPGEPEVLSSIPGTLPLQKKSRALSHLLPMYTFVFLLCSVNICFLYALMLGAHIIVMFYWWINFFYHYIMTFFVFCGSVWFKVYFSHKYSHLCYLLVIIYVEYLCILSFSAYATQPNMSFLQAIYTWIFFPLIHLTSLFLFSSFFETRLHCAVQADFELTL